MCGKQGSDCGLGSTAIVPMLLIPASLLDGNGVTPSSAVTLSLTWVQVGTPEKSVVRQTPPLAAPRNKAGTTVPFGKLVSPTASALTRPAIFWTVVLTFIVPVC